MDDILRAHAAELNPAYTALEMLGDPNREHAAALLDFLIGENLALPSGLAALGNAVPSLRRAVEAAGPDRGCIGYIVSHFQDWVAGLTPAACAVFLEEFPSLAPAAKDLGDAGMQQVLEAVNRDPRVLAPVAAYAMSNREIIIAMAALANEAAKGGRVDLLQALVEAVPLDKMESGKDAEKLVPAIARVPQALAAAVALAKRDVSSAHGACRALAKVLPKHPHATAYLDGFTRLVEAIGAQCAGFGTAALPALYSKHGVDAADNLVDRAVECARIYGPRAAQALLEQKTKASRQLLQ